MAEKTDRGRWLAEAAPFWTANTLRNIREFGALATSLSTPALSALSQQAGMQGQRMAGDIESALQGRGARGTGFAGLASLSARGAASAQISQQRSQFMQQLFQMILQGGLQMGSEQLQGFTAIRQSEIGAKGQQGEWWQQLLQGTGSLGAGAAAIIAA